jgi:NAD(P)-dependent dehydrogenase (short-subunit alcohol dehydrogenase family)
VVRERHFFCVHLQGNTDIITANGGIGFELARQLLSKTGPTWHVLLGSRSIEKGKTALDQLKSQDLPGTVELVQIDVTDDSTIVRAGRDAETTHGHMDVVVNNAAVAYDGERSRESMHASFDTNVVGPMRVAEVFAPLLQKSTSSLGPRIVNISSRAGSISRRLDKNTMIYDSHFVEYRTSKAALNMLSVCHVWEYGKLGIKTFMFCPGFTESDLSPMAKIENGAKPVAESARPIVDIIEGKRDGEQGKFLFDGGVAEW